jgi:methyl-accepting chemotaxis protein
MLFLVGAVGYRSSETLVDNDHRVTHSHLVLEGLDHVLSLLKDTETGQRGYVMTGEDAYLEPYLAARPAIARAMEDLRHLTADAPQQQRRLDEAAPLINAKLAELQRTIDLRRTQGFDASLKVVLTNEGKNAMDEFRRLIGAAEQDERDLLKQRADLAESVAATTKATILGAAALASLCVLLVAWYITRSLNEQLGSAVSNMRSCSAELEAAASQQAAGARQQSSAAAEVSTTIMELLSTSKQIADSARGVARIAEQAGQGARGGDQTVQRAQEAIVAIKRQVDLIVAHMLELGRKSQQAGGILELVNELAEQTNILSINATIEAAGAGEHGRRFAAVAEEIRKLADRVGASTKEIRALIDDIRAAVNTTVMATETGTKAVDAGTRQFGEVTTAFADIARLVGTTTEAAREIELSTKQQASAVEQVNTAITSVAQATKETEASSGQTLQTARQLTGLSADVSRLVQAGA